MEENTKPAIVLIHNKKNFRMRYFFPMSLLFLLSFNTNAQNVGIGTSTPQSKLHIISLSNEVARLDAGNIEIAEDPVPMQRYLGKRPNELADAGEQQLQDRGLVRFMVRNDQVKCGYFSLHRPGGY